MTVMNNKTNLLRKAVAFVLAVSLLAPGGLTALAAADIPSDWAQSELSDARGKGLVIAQADSNYQGNISRRLFCALVVNLVETIIGSPVAISVLNPFNDTNDDNIVKAYQLGIVNGVSATQFSPDTFITREQIAAMMMRGARKLDELRGGDYAAAAGAQHLVFADQSEISSWALSDVQTANALNIMKGVGNGRIDPKGNTTVEQSILLVNRLFDGFTENTAPPTVPQNQAPAALSNPVSFSVSEQTELLIEASQLAADPEGGELEVVAINGQTSAFSTSFGTAQLTADGKISYRSNDVSSSIIDDFAVTVSDGTNMTHINVRVNVSHTLSLIITPTISSVSVNGTPAMNKTVGAHLISYSGGLPSPAPLLSYQWMISASAGGAYTAINGATSSSYQIPQSSVGKYLKLRVTASGSAGGTATSAAVGPVTYGFAGGDGTVSDPYQIATAEQFMLLDTVPTQNICFGLTADISLAANAYIKSTFNGSLYGNGKSITLNIGESDGNYVGLFSKTSGTSRIDTVRILGSIETAYSYVGGVSGRNDGTIILCSSRAVISADDYTGGITGFNTGTVTRCVSYSVIDADDYVGCIAGNNSGTVSRCTVTADGNVTAGAMAGGAVGKNASSGSVLYCLSHSDVFSNGNEGGLVGWNEGTVSDCYSTGKVDGYNNRGGLVGHNNGGTISRSYYDKETSGRSDTGRGIPKTTAEMKTQSTYDGWNFTNIWGFTSGFYPWLK